MPRTRISTSPPVGRKTYRVDEVVAMLGVGRGTVEHLMKDGVLKRVKIGNIILITMDSIDAMLMSGAAAE